MTSLTAQTADFICGFQGAALPEEAIHRSKIGVLDCVGVALAGSREPVGRIMSEYAEGLAAGGEATLWGRAKKVAASEAALVNGTLAHALDYDDMNRSMLGHPTSVLAPALFAVCEQHKLSGRKLLEGYVVGLEVMARLGRIFGQAAYARSWHPTAIMGALGASAAAAYLMRLDYERTVNALGIAASEASGLKKNFGSMTKPLHAGSAARKGVWAATLAAKGLTADAEVLDGKFGFFEMFHGRAVEVEAAPAPADAERLDILESGLVFKQYPCCGGVHSLIDNVLRLRPSEALQPDEVQEIECRLHPSRIAYLDRPQARESLEAKFSIQYCVATALVNGRVGLRQFSEEGLAQPATRSLMAKVRISPAEELGGFASEVILRTRGGKQVASRLPEPRGSRNSPFTEEEMLAKFVDCATEVMSGSQAEQAGAALMSLDAAEDVGVILGTLASRA
jgi:2-methylcitrate dehydratase PrpD